jgi:hypothetical protein
MGRRGRLMAGHLQMVQLSGRISHWRTHIAVRGRLTNVGRTVRRAGPTILRRLLCPGLVRPSTVRLDAIACSAIPRGAFPRSPIACSTIHYSFWQPCVRRRDCGKPHGENSQGGVNTSPASCTTGSFSGGGGVRLRRGKLPVQRHRGFRTTRRTAQSYANLYHGYGPLCASPFPNIHLSRYRLWYGNRKVMVVSISSLKNELRLRARMVCSPQRNCPKTHSFSIAPASPKEPNRRAGMIALRPENDDICHWESREPVTTRHLNAAAAS